MTQPTSTAVRVPMSLFLGLFFLLFSVIFNYTLSIMASPYIVGDLGGSNDTATYTVSLFALGNALGVPLGRALLHKIGPARLVLLAVLLFAFFSWMCAIAPTYPFFNAARFMQGFVSGPFYALGFYLFSTLEPKGKKALFTAISLMIFTVGPVIGACWGGWIAYEWNWRWIFYFNIPLKIFLAWFLWRTLKKLDLSVEKAPFDTVGYCSYFLAIFCLGFAVILGQELDWFRSSLITSMITIGGFSLLFFIPWELYHPHPVLYLRMLKNPVLFFALLNLAVLFSTYFGMIILTALWLSLWVNYTPDWIGLLIGTMAISGLFPFSLIERRMKQLDNRIYLMLATLFLAIACIHTMYFNVEINFGRIANSRLLAGLGLALFLAPVFRLCFNRLCGEESLHAVGLFQVTRALSSGLGAAFYDTLWQRRQVFYHERLGSQLTVSSAETEEFFVKADLVNLQGDAANAQLEYYLERQSSALALDDCFYLMAWILIGLLIVSALTFLSRRRSFITD